MKYQNFQLSITVTEDFMMIWHSWWWSSYMPKRDTHYITPMGKFPDLKTNFSS